MIRQETSVINVKVKLINNVMDRHVQYGRRRDTVAHTASSRIAAGELNEEEVEVTRKEARGNVGLCI